MCNNLLSINVGENNTNSPLILTFLVIIFWILQPICQSIFFGYVSNTCYRLEICGQGRLWFECQVYKL